MSESRARPGGRRRARSMWLKIHLYLGLWAGAVLAVVGVAGSLLVYSEQIDAALNPQLEAGAASGMTLGPDEALASIERRYGKLPLVLFPPQHGNASYRALTPDSSGRSQAIEEVLVDGASGEILAGRVRGTYFVSIVHTLHTELLMGRTGAYVVAGGGGLVLLSVASGLYLWWPRGRAFRRALTFHWQWRAGPLSFELHRLSGFYLASVLCVLAVTGLYLTLPEPFTAMVGQVARVTPWPQDVTTRFESIAPGDDARSQVSSAEGRRLTLAEVDRIVEARSPGAMVTSYVLPATLHEPYEVSFRAAAQIHDAHGRNSLWIHPSSGRILASREITQLGPGDAFIDLQIDLHNGRVLGRTGEALVFVTGLSLPLLFGTGIYLWWMRRQPRRR